MAKTNITTKDGTRIIIEGSPEEVATILNKISERDKSTRDSKRGNKNISVGSLPELQPEQQKITPTNLIRSLSGEGFFKKAKKIGEIKNALEERGHLYALSALSPALLRLIRKRQLRRVREKGIWLYTN